MTYRTKHFILQELVDPAIFKARGERAWELLRPEALVTLDQLREKFGAITVNDWAEGGQYKESGLRRFDTKTGAVWSMHRYGGADDCKFKLVTPREVYDYVLAHPDEFPQLTTVENVDATPSWFHFDTRNHDKKGIWVVNP